MHATARDLPPELIENIVQLLGETFELVSAWKICPSSPVGISKRELGSCSLVCKFWTRLLRQHLFRELTLKTPEDGRLFRAFVEKPASAELSISRLVSMVYVEYDFAGTPWLHHIFASWCPQRFLDFVDVTAFDSSNATAHAPRTRLRSIYHSVPRPLPPRMTPIDTLRLRDVSFSGFSDLGKFLASFGGELRVVILESIVIKDSEGFGGSRKLQLCEYRPATKGEVYRCPASHRLLRTLVPTRKQRIGRPWFLRPHVLLALEEVLCTLLTVGSPPRPEENSTPEYMFGMRYQFEDGFAPGFTLISTSRWWMAVEFPRDHIGVVVSLRLCAEDLKSSSLLWRRIDRDLGSVISDVEILRVFIEPENQDELGPLTKMLSRNMPHFVRANDKLQIKLSNGEGGWYPARAEDEGVDEVNEVEDEGRQRRES